MGRFVVLIGAVVVVVGLALMAVEHLTGGRSLPGDLVIRRPGVTIFIPIVTMIVISLVLTVLLNLLLRR